MEDRIIAEVISVASGDLIQSGQNRTVPEQSVKEFVKMNTTIDIPEGFSRLPSSIMSGIVIALPPAFNDPDQIAPARMKLRGTYVKVNNQTHEKQTPQ